MRLIKRLRKLSAALPSALEEPLKPIADQAVSQTLRPQSELSLNMALR